MPTPNSQKVQLNFDMNESISIHKFPLEDTLLLNDPKHYQIDPEVYKVYITLNV